MKVSGRKYPTVHRIVAGAHHNLLKNIKQSGLDISIFESEFENEPGRLGYTAEINGRPVLTPHDDIAYFDSADAAEKFAYEDTQKNRPQVPFPKGPLMFNPQ
jgi:hypothetical protein